MDEALLTCLLKELAETKKFIQKLFKKYKLLKMKRNFSQYIVWEKERRRKEEEERKRKEEEEKKRKEQEEAEMLRRKELDKKLEHAKGLYAEEEGKSNFLSNVSKIMEDKT